MSCYSRYLFIQSTDVSWVLPVWPTLLQMPEIYWWTGQMKSLAWCRYLSVLLILCPTHQTSSPLCIQQLTSVVCITWALHPLAPSINCSCCCSVAKSCLTLSDPMDCSMPDFPDLHYLPEFAQTHVHWVSDATQSSHSLSPSSPLALCLSQHQGLFQWVGSSHQVVKVLELQPVLPMNIHDWFPVELTGLISLLSKGLSRVFSSTTIQKHQFFSIQPSLWFNSHIHIWLPEKP